MNTQQITRTATVVSAVVVAASIVTTAPAFAEHDVDGHHSDRGASTSYTIPFAAIGGRTMAQYLADHQAPYFPGSQP